MRLHLASIQPNPIYTGTTIDFDLPSARRSSLSVIDVSGRLVRTLVDRDFAGGHHRIEWDGRDKLGSPVASGVYFFRLAAGGETVHRKMVVVR